ncbi:MAG: peptidylprolyl isomerase [Peptostreptococcaceae bacterium]
MESGKKAKVNFKFKKNIVLSILLGIICLLIGFNYGKNVGRKLPATSKNYSSNKVFAKVGDVEITGKELGERMEPLFYLEGKTKLTSEEIKVYEYSMIDYLTTREALYLEGKEKGITVAKEELDKEYESMMSSIVEEFQMSEDDYLKQFNVTKEYLSKDVEKEIIAIKYMKEFTDVTEEEAKNYYNKNKDEFIETSASHILIKTSDDEGNELSDKDIEKAKKQAKDILKKAKDGEDFETLAKEYSQDTSALNGGTLGYSRKGELVDSFEEAVSSLKNNEIYDEVVESDYGYHIIKKNGEREASFDSVKDELITTLSYNKKNTLIDDVLAKYNVEIEE